jgi:hypothetical protein
LVLAVAACLALLGLGNNAFWDDEANTALFARNLIGAGQLTAWDGTNVIGFRQGAELNDHLLNVYMPPLQYYVAAGGLRFFGLTTIGGRLPFVLLGLGSVAALILVARWYFRGRVVEWLPALLVALNPAYLMFMRQCRYYAIVSLLTLVILGGWSHPKGSARSGPIAIAIGSVAALLLMLTNYLNAVALGLMLPLLFCLKRYRTRKNLAYLASIYGVFVGVGIYVLFTANPLALNVSYRSTVTGLHRVMLLFWWHITGLAHFEFFPTVTLPLLIVLWCFLRGRRHVGSVRDGLLLCLLLFSYSVTIVAFSPQTVDANTRVADMRYVVALIPLGAMATAVVLVQLWRASPLLGRGVALALGLALVSSNVFTSAFFHRQQLRSTLYEYVWENTHDYTTGNESLITYLNRLPPGRVIRVVPDFMTYPSMFYAPQQHYCCQLGEDHVLEPGLRSVVPDYVYFSRVLPDYLLVGANISPQQLLNQSALAFGFGRYRLGPEVGTDFRDCSRPELPWHCFRPEKDKRQGFLVLERVTADTHGG